MDYSNISMDNRLILFSCLNLISLILLRLQAIINVKHTVLTFFNKKMFI